MDQEAAREAYLASKENDTGPKTYDKILADIALEVPGYGGHYEDENGVSTSTSWTNGSLMQLNQFSDNIAMPMSWL